MGPRPALEAGEGMFAWPCGTGTAVSSTWSATGSARSRSTTAGSATPGLRVGAEGLCLLPGFRADIDRDAVALYLRHNCVPAPHTIYRGVAKLLPGQLLHRRMRHPAPRAPPTRAYWSARQAVEDARRRPLAGTGEEMADQVESALSDSVAARMVADVPVGAFLSGGVDSSMVVALMQQHSAQPVRTFTVGFADRAFDESAEAAAVAAHLGTDHTPLDVTDGDALEVIPRMPDIWDEPFGDVSAIPMHLVSRLARSQVTVALSGRRRGRALRRVQPARLARAAVAAVLRPARPGPAGGRRRARPVPPGLIDGAARAATVLPPHRQIRNPTSKVAKVGKVLAASGPEDAYLSLVSYWDDAESMVLGAGPTVSMASRPSEWPVLDGITEQMLWLDLVGYLPDDILTKLDRAAMATSLETRVPFLDRAVFDVAWRLPMSAKLHDGATKWILRQVLYRHVPAELIERPKMGFGFPIGAMLRARCGRGPRSCSARVASDGRDCSIPDPSGGHGTSTSRDGAISAYELWAVLALQAWLDRWVPGRGWLNGRRSTAAGVRRPAAGTWL